MTANTRIAGKTGVSTARLEAIGARTIETGMLSITADSDAGTQTRKATAPPIFPDTIALTAVPISSMNPTIFSAATSPNLLERRQSSN